LEETNNGKRKFTNTVECDYEMEIKNSFPLEIVAQIYKGCAWQRTNFRHLHKNWEFSHFRKENVFSLQHQYTPQRKNTDCITYRENTSEIICGKLAEFVVLSAQKYFFFKF